MYQSWSRGSRAGRTNPPRQIGSCGQLGCPDTLADALRSAAANGEKERERESEIESLCVCERGTALAGCDDDPLRKSSTVCAGDI